MIPAHIFDGAEDLCRECDDVFDGGDLPGWAEPTRCTDAGHRRLLDPTLIKWHICDRCKGEGTLRGYPGVYTSDDFAEDPDLADDYMAHTRPCEECGGRGSVRGVDEAAVYGTDNGDGSGSGGDYALECWVRDYYESEAISAQERRMGA